jgi:transposase, IS5 family
MPPWSKCRGSAICGKRTPSLKPAKSLKRGINPKHKPSAASKTPKHAKPKQHEEQHYGYKNHLNADQQHRLIPSYAVTPASVHDSQVFDELLDQTEASDGNKRAVYADRGYRSQDQEQRLADARIESRIREKGTRGKPLSEEQKQANRSKSKGRARVEHVFGAQAAMGGHRVRTIGLQRAKVKIGLMNLVYSRMRLVQRIKHEVKAVNRVLTDNYREGAPIGV